MTEPDLSLAIGSMTMRNPVGVASGTFGFGQEYEPLINLDRLGAIYTKAVTLAPREGNPPPRLFETPQGLLNSIGLANPGVAAFVQEKLPFLKARSCAIVVNIAGSTEDEYCRVTGAIEENAGPGHNGVDAYEVNISCPNVSHGGMAFGTDPVQVERLVGKLRKLTARPIIVKLSPNVTDIASIAKAAEQGGADALTCINTVVGMAIDTERLQPCLARGTGGLSGPAIRPIGVACTWKAARAVRIPIIGCGGISTADDAIQYLLAGASAIQVGTALFADPAAPMNILEGIIVWMKRKNVGTLAEIPKLLKG
ncbi:MAG: dihydroorotate dehydrogenase [Spirochaetaceae bacterium]|nr:dihydroorotate dehydrogenase [Spirochaetaceae bacterium]